MVALNPRRDDEAEREAREIGELEELGGVLIERSGLVRDADDADRELPDDPTSPARQVSPAFSAPLGSH